MQKTCTIKNNMISLYHKTIKQKVMKKLVYLLVVVFAVSMTTTSCGTAKSGCGYQKAQKYNKKQSKKAHRYHSRNNRGGGVFINF